MTTSGFIENFYFYDHYVDCISEMNVQIFKSFRCVSDQIDGNHTYLVENGF